jgi:hypothetical protein
VLTTGLGSLDTLHPTGGVVGAIISIISTQFSHGVTLSLSALGNLKHFSLLHFFDDPANLCGIHTDPKARSPHSP